MRVQHFISLLLGLLLAAVVDCNEEGDILHAQKLAFQDPNDVLRSWDPTLVNPCTWFHITCNIDNSVVRVDLGNAGLSGYIIPDLGRLTNLQYLVMSSNNITGEIPASLGNLTKLVSLDLFENRLSGPIPSSLGNIQSLRFLRLNGNMLSGVLPTPVLQLVITGDLAELDVSDNTLSDTIRKPEKRVTKIIQDARASG